MSKSCEYRLITKEYIGMQPALLFQYLSNKNLKQVMVSVHLLFVLQSLCLV